MSEDLNAISTYLHQILKDRNINLFQGQQSGYAYPGCVINGCEISLTESGNSVGVSTGPGLLLFSSLIDTENYSGTVVPVDTGSIGTLLFPASGSSVKYSIDIRYTEADETSSLPSRNFYHAPTDLVSAKNTSIYKTPVFEYVLTPGAETIGDPLNAQVGALEDGWNRLATFLVTSSGLYLGTGQLTYTIPYIWNLQSWPGTSHSLNSATTLTLADTLSAIRAELSAIIGKTNWYDKPSISLSELNSQTVAGQATVSDLSLGFKSIVPLRYVSGVSYPQQFTVPAGCTKLYVKMWGPGGSGGYGWVRLASSASYFDYQWGGGGGSGAYVEDVISVTPGQHIPYFVGPGGSGVATRFAYNTSGDFNVAGAGGLGGNATTVSPGAGGVGGVGSGSSTAIIVPGTPGSLLGYGEGAAAFSVAGCSYKAVITDSVRPRMFGCGGGGWAAAASGTPPISTAVGPGIPGGDGLILIYSN